MSKESVERGERFIDLRPDCALSLGELDSILNEIKVVYARFVGANKVSAPDEAKLYESMVKLIQSLQTLEKTPESPEPSLESIRREQARTLMGRLYFFTMLAQARGWEDELTQKSWMDFLKVLETL